MVLSGVATTVKCDNPRCTALYEVSSFLGGHTFTCNKCGSRVTIRDLSFIGGPAQNPGPQRELHTSRRTYSVTDWVIILAVVGGLLGIIIVFSRM